MDDKITKPTVRKIIDDFVQEINQRKQEGAKPSKEVIEFRNWVSTNHEEQVWWVPTGLLRFRKENGRIKSDVMSHERNYGPLSEISDESQKIIKKFLEEKDPEKNRELINSMRVRQRDAAIITADGFLINGNRRKMALEKLWEEKRDEKYRWMKVIILPGKDDHEKGGPPTLLEIEQIENRCQLQSSGKSEYYNFDKALSMRDKVRLGMSIIEQLRDDPNYPNLSEKELEKEVKKKEEEFIKPLDCIDRYLTELGRDGLYDTISTGMSDKEGRWQAFLDYSNHVRKKLDDDYQRIKMGIAEDETGDVEELAFKIIRKREFSNMPKVHKIMRDLPKWLTNKEAKKELFKLLEVDLELPEKDSLDENGNEYDERTKDHKWSAKHETTLNKHVKIAQRIIEHEKERETPLTLMDAALKKLEHENMDLHSIDIQKDYHEARKRLVEIQRIASGLESELYELKKKIKKLQDKFRKS